MQIQKQKNGILSDLHFWFHSLKKLNLEHSKNNLENLLDLEQVRKVEKELIRLSSKEEDNKRDIVIQFARFFRTLCDRIQTLYSQENANDISLSILAKTIYLLDVGIETVFSKYNFNNFAKAEREEIKEIYRNFENTHNVVFAKRETLLKMVSEKASETNGTEPVHTEQIRISITTTNTLPYIQKPSHVISNEKPISEVENKLVNDAYDLLDIWNLKDKVSNTEFLEKVKYYDSIKIEGLERRAFELALVDYLNAFNKIIPISPTAKPSQVFAKLKKFVPSFQYKIILEDVDSETGEISLSVDIYGTPFSIKMNQDEIPALVAELSNFLQQNQGDTLFRLNIAQGYLFYTIIPVDKLEYVLSKKIFSGKKTPVILENKIDNPILKKYNEFLELIDVGDENILSEFNDLLKTKRIDNSFKPELAKYIFWDILDFNNKIVAFSKEWTPKDVFESIRQCVPSFYYSMDRQEKDVLDDTWIVDVNIYGRDITLRIKADNISDLQNQINGILNIYENLHLMNFPIFKDSCSFLVVPVGKKADVLNTVLAKEINLLN